MQRHYAASFATAEIITWSGNKISTATFTLHKPEIAYNIYGNSEASGSSKKVTIQHFVKCQLTE